MKKRESRQADNLAALCEELEELRAELAAQGIDADNLDQIDDNQTDAAAELAAVHLTARDLQTLAEMRQSLDSGELCAQFAEMRETLEADAEQARRLWAMQDEAKALRADHDAGRVKLDADTLAALDSLREKLTGKIKAGQIERLRAELDRISAAASDSAGRKRKRGRRS